MLTRSLSTSFQNMVLKTSTEMQKNKTPSILIWSTPRFRRSLLMTHTSLSFTASRNQKKNCKMVNMVKEIFVSTCIKSTPKHTYLILKNQFSKTKKLIICLTTIASIKTINQFWNSIIIFITWKWILTLKTKRLHLN